MIQPIETSESQETTGARHAKAATGGADPTGKTFASVLATENKWHDKSRVESSDTKIHTPAGETWRPVRGDDDYARIVTGPRKGMYINLSHGARRGEVFRVEHRGGERVHVYESGKVVRAAKDSGKVHGHHDHHRRGENVHTAHRGRGETWAPVPGHSDYADILSGPRNGYYVNTSGGERDGMVFHIVHRHGREYHIYGQGKDRQVVLVRHPHHKDAKPDKPAKVQDAGTGGASPG